VLGNGGGGGGFGRASERERSQGGARRRDAIAAGGGVAARHSGSSRWQANGRAATALSWSPAPMRWHGPRVARSRLRASGGGVTGSALTRLPSTQRSDPHPPRSPGELAGRRQLELEDRAVLVMTGLEDPSRACHVLGFCA